MEFALSQNSLLTGLEKLLLEMGIPATLVANTSEELTSSIIFVLYLGVMAPVVEEFILEGSLDIVLSVTGKYLRFYSRLLFSHYSMPTLHKKSSHLWRVLFLLMLLLNTASNGQ